jgi:oligosaccharide reducing-end xylanase
LPAQLNGKGGTSGSGADEGGTDSGGGDGGVEVAGKGGKGGSGTVAGNGGASGTAAGEPSSGGDPGEGGAPPSEPSLTPLVGPLSYPNPIGNLLGVTEEEITEHIENVYEQLYHSTTEGEAIFFVLPEDKTQAYIRDILHNDIRTEGLGLGMLISVQLDRQDDFDRLWKYSKNHKLISKGDIYNAGYYASVCDGLSGTVSCIDPYGMQQFAMSLIFAHNRWGSDGTHDYETDALELLDVMLHKQDRNGGIVEGVTNVFDSESRLVFHEPNASAVSFTRPSIEMPAYYQLWEQATGNEFWGVAATAAREFFTITAHETTGLMPRRAYFDGTPYPEYGTYGPEAYRVMLNIVLDQIWTGADPWAVAECTKVVEFFASAGPGTSFALDGTKVDDAPEEALVLVNGVTAVAASDSDARTQFIRNVWEFPIPVGQVRYYHGLLQLYGLLVLTGRMQVY